MSIQLSQEKTMIIGEEILGERMGVELFMNFIQIIILIIVLGELTMKLNVLKIMDISTVGVHALGHVLTPIPNLIIVLE